jgi:hypothetical protein
MSGKRYNMTLQAVMNWAKHEISHVGNIAGVEDPDIQYAYAQSTVNGMLHLHDALAEMVNVPEYERQQTDIKKMRNKIERVLKHVIQEYEVDLQDIQMFDTRRVLGNISYVQSRRNRSMGRKNRQRKTRRNALW